MSIAFTPAVYKHAAGFGGRTPADIFPGAELLPIAALTSNTATSLNVSG